MKKHIPPALALFFIAPIFGELFSGSSPLNEYINPVTFITLSLLYGCGAIIVRELAIRWKKGWLSIFILGAAYGIYEEGILVQSFFDPGWVDLGDLAVYGRVAGVNWVWTEHLTVFHMLISIAASIAFVEALYPEHRVARWVTSRGWWIANWVGVLSLVIPWKIMVKYDSGGWWLLSWIAIIVLGLDCPICSCPSLNTSRTKIPGTLEVLPGGVSRIFHPVRHCVFLRGKTDHSVPGDHA